MLSPGIETNNYRMTEPGLLSVGKKSKDLQKLDINFAKPKELTISVKEDFKVELVSLANQPVETVQLQRLKLFFRLLA